MTILVVDDERNIADSIAGTLIAELNTDAEVHVGGRIAVLVNLETESTDAAVIELGKDIAMQIAFGIVSRSENYFSHRVQRFFLCV